MGTVGAIPARGRRPEVPKWNPKFPRIETGVYLNFPVPPNSLGRPRPGKAGNSRKGPFYEFIGALDLPGKKPLGGGKIIPTVPRAAERKPGDWLFGGLRQGNSNGGWPKAGGKFRGALFWNPRKNSGFPGRTVGERLGPESWKPEKGGESGGLRRAKFPWVPGEEPKGPRAGGTPPLGKALLSKVGKAPLFQGLGGDPLLNGGGKPLWE